MQTQEPSQKDTTNETKKPSAKSACCGIYGLRNKVNGKWYVGQSVNAKDRWRKYKKLKCENQPKLHNALTKYGYIGFEVMMIEECSEELLNERETHWIRHHDSFNNGYNCNEGGNQVRMTEETRQKIGAKSKGRKHTEETKEKLRKIFTGRPGTPMSAEHCAKLVNLTKKRVVTQKTRDKLRMAHLGMKASAGVENLADSV